ncbi:MAG: LysM peptidoglycan-binding domain-containing protein [Rhizobiaceae bacterium]
MTNPLKVLLFLAGGTAIAAVAAYLSGALDPILQSEPPAAVANVPTDGAASVPTSETTLKEDRLETEDKPAAATPSVTTDAAPSAEPATPSDDVQAEVASTGTQTQPAEPAQQPEAAPSMEAAATPSFDLLRVEGDGSMVIAGRAAPNATVELLNGETVIGSGKAGPQGDFVVILDNPLAPGDYQITIRTINGDNSKSVSTQTAIVSVPVEPTGQVLAMIEEPGKPSEIITVPQPAPSSAVEAPKPDKPEVAEGAGAPAEQAPASEPAPVEAPATATEPQEADEPKAAETAGASVEPKAAEAASSAEADKVQAPAADAATAQAEPPADTTEPEAATASGTPDGTTTDQPAQADAPAQVATADPTAGQKPTAKEQPSEQARPSQIVVEAVEIDGRNVFVAGRADPGSVVRAYANEILLGEALTSAGGRFLVEATRDLPVGSYIIRADVISKDGKSVMARAAVPFEREPGENIAAVADSAHETAPKVAETEASTTPEAEAKALEESAESKVAAAATPPAASSATENAQATPPAEAETPPVAVEDNESPAEPSANAEAPAAASPATQSEIPAVASDATEASPASETPAPVAGAGETAPAAPAATETPTVSAEVKPAPSSAEDKAAVPSTASETPKAEQQPPAEVAGNTVTEEVTAPPLRSVKSAVIIRRGDTLWRISRRVYGRGVRYSTIYLANQDQIRDPDMIWPGQVFGVPNRTAEGEEADISKMGEQGTTQQE